jgi:hypothetical protein
MPWRRRAAEMSARNSPRWRAAAALDARSSVSSFFARVRLQGARMIFNDPAPESSPFSSKEWSPSALATTHTSVPSAVSAST